MRLSQLHAIRQTVGLGFNKFLHIKPKSLQLVNIKMKVPVQKSSERRLDMSYSETSHPGIKLSISLAKTKAATVLRGLETFWYQDGSCIMRVHNRDDSCKHAPFHFPPLFPWKSIPASKPRSRQRAEAVEKDRLCCVSVCISDGLLCWVIRKRLFSDCCLKEEWVFIFRCFLHHTNEHESSDFILS